MSKVNQKQDVNLQTFYFGGNEGVPFRAQVINNEPYFVGKDLCLILGFSKYRDVLSNLDEDERVSIYVDTPGGRQKMIAVTESGFYHLVFQSKVQRASEFRRKVTMEVLPAIRRKGYYGVYQKESDYIDAQDTPYTRKMYNDTEVRCIEVEGREWINLGDLFRAIGSSTCVSQSVKKLNAKNIHAVKIMLFGATHPGWFVDAIGAALLVSGSRKIQGFHQLKLPF